MSASLGIDLGTSGVKALLVDDHDQVLAEATAPLTIDRPRPLWSEQDPDAWWIAAQAALDLLADRHPGRLSDVAAIGLSGQMLGVALLDEADRPIRPALLWSDGRAGDECREIESEVPGFTDLVGCRAMPGFPAPKLRWLRRHEPANLDRASRILLPKDVIGLHLTGEAATDPADGSATLLMDTRAGTWNPGLITACGIGPEQLPRIVGCGETVGVVRTTWAERWGFRPGTPVVAGGGDNMCGALGAGVVRSAQACISLGTSGVYAVANTHFLPARGGGMHTHRHVVPRLFLQNGCVLSAGAALAWVAALVSAGDISMLLEDVEAASIPTGETPVFTPYLAGERTPHTDPTLTGAFSGLTLATTRLHLVQGVLEGVAMALGDCHRALLASGAAINEIAVIGGGARSRLWATLVASEIGLPLRRSASGAFGPALGAARLARACLGGPLVAADDADEDILPSADFAEGLAGKRPLYEAHRALKQAG